MKAHVAAAIVVLCAGCTAGKPLDYSSEDFELHLGPEWAPAHEDTHFGFQDVQGGQQVTIAVSRARRDLDIQALGTAALDLLRIRQQALRSMAGGAVQLGDVATEYREQGMDLAFTALDERNQVQVRVTVVARPARIVTMSYNKYQPLLAADAFNARAGAIRAALRVR